LLDIRDVKKINVYQELFELHGKGAIRTVVEFEVPLVAITLMTGSYIASEAVYTLTSTANCYHIWDIYEFGGNTGTTNGFVPTFSVYS